MGCVTAASLAARHKVVAYDPDPAVLGHLKEGRPPIFEPGLQSALEAAVEKGNLSFSSDVSPARGADVIIIAFDTPVSEKDEPDLSPIEKAVGSIAPYLSDGQLVVVSSQVPVGTCRRLHGRLLESKKGITLCCCPENLRLGTALENFSRPGRLILGISGDSAKEKLGSLFEGIEGERIFMSLESAEMAKHAMNTYLATLISFSGEVADLCEKTGANAIEVMEALRKEPRVSPQAPIMPGLGFAGGTLARDVQALRAAGRQKGVPTPVLDAVLASNRARAGYLRQRLEGALGTISGKTIALFGLTYKPGTDTLRRSLALELASSLSALGALIRAYDPAVKSKAGLPDCIELCSSPVHAAQGADAVVISTAWEEFRALDYSEVCSGMKHPVIIDARNLLAKTRLPQSVDYFGVGVEHAKKG